MADDIYNFDKDFDPVEFRNVMRRFRDEAREDAMRKHPAGKTTTETTETTKTNPARLTEEETAHVGLAVLEFLFLTVPLALLLAGLVVVPITEAIFNAEIGFWTAFLLLLTLRWLIPRPRKSVLIRGGR